jgi:hypothetical protein
LPPLEEKRSRQRRPVLTLCHTITNHRITLRVFACPAQSVMKSNGKLRWASPEHLTRLTLSAAHRRALERILASGD